jgi:hypothetical protein
MNRQSRILVASCLLLAGVPAAARAQPGDESRRIEIGGGLGNVVSWWSGPFPGADFRVTVPVNARGDVETLVAASSHTDSRNGLLGMYAVQFRQHVRVARSDRVTPFITYGGGGVFLTDRRAYVTPPVVGLVGGGLDHRLARHLSARIEAQAMVFAIIPVGLRVAGGISVPIGEPRRIVR